MSKLKILAVTFAISLWSTTALAVPLLQLDIAGGSYDQSTETIVSADSDFTLYAILTPQHFTDRDHNKRMADHNEDSNHDKGDLEWLLGDTYYISVAITPQLDLGADLGESTFTFNGDSVAVTEDMNYGIPPLEDSLTKDRGDLAPHGIFPTYFSEFAFQFNQDNVVATYNSQDRALSGEDVPGAPTDSDNTSYLVAFSIGSFLPEGYALHFDLYNTEVRDGKRCKTTIDDIDINFFAPFSHDAEGPSRSVPEPSTMFLFGTGLIGIAGLTRRRVSRKS